MATPRVYEGTQKKNTSAPTAIPGNASAHDYLPKPPQPPNECAAAHHCDSPLRSSQDLWHSSYVVCCYAVAIHRYVHSMLLMLTEKRNSGLRSDMQDMLFICVYSFKP